MVPVIFLDSASSARQYTLLEYIVPTASNIANYKTFFGNIFVANIFYKARFI